MITISIAIVHAFGTNRYFSPDILYLGALVADVAIAQSIFGAGCLG